MEKKTAAELQISDVGRSVRSEVYRSKNKTAKPLPEREYQIDSIYAHSNGNILLNGGFPYLRADTIITFLD